MKKRTFVVLYVGYKAGVFAEKYLKPAIIKALNDQTEKQKTYTSTSAPPENVVKTQKKMPTDKFVLVFETLDSAQDVMSRLRSVNSDVGRVTMEELNDLIGRTSGFDDTKRGWTDLSDAEILDDREGKVVWLTLPKPVVLND